MNNARTYYSHETEMRVMREKAVLVFLFLVMGLGAGAAAALLYAPKPGKKTREELANAMEEGFSNGREAVEPALRKLQKEFVDLRQKVDERLAEVRSS